MRFKIITTEYFFRRARRFLRKHPELRERFAQIVDDLKANPYAPHLRYHHLGGALGDVESVSLTYEYRIILTVRVTEKEVILLDVGSHDEVYRL